MPMKIAPGMVYSLLLLFLLLAAFFLPSTTTGENLSPSGNPYTWVKVGPVRVQAEVVSSPEKLYQGLSGRPDLPAGRGMLFVMPELAVQSFCMRGMRFPLDILWLAPGRVVGLAKNISPRYPGSITSPAPVQFVLEVPAGFCDRYGIQPGTPAEW